VLGVSTGCSDLQPLWLRGYDVPVLHRTPVGDAEQVVERVALAAEEAVGEDEPETITPLKLAGEHLEAVFAAEARRCAHDPRP
jgi:hypothetical protein